MQERKTAFDYKAEWDTLSLPNRAHHFQVYSAAVASADNIVINKTPLVISLTKEDSTSGGSRPQSWCNDYILTTQVTKNPKIWAKKCGYYCVILLLYTHWQHIKVLKHIVLSSLGRANNSCQ